MPNATLFPDWQRTHPPQPALPPQIAAMYRAHGKSLSGLTCGDCAHLIDSPTHGKKYFKCELYGITRGAATDWRKKWKACNRLKVNNPPP